MDRKGVYEPYEPEDRYEQGLAEEHHTDIRVVEERHAEIRTAAGRRHQATLARCGSATVGLVTRLRARAARRRGLRRHRRPPVPPAA